MIGIEYKRTAGLGNKLFPCARALVAAKAVGLPIIDPIWFSPRGAGIIRGGVDKRVFLGKIWLLRNFKRLQDSRPFMSQFVMRKKVKVSDLDEFYFLFERYGSSVFYEFAWDAAHNFRDLFNHRDFIKQEIFQLARPRLPKLNQEKFVAVNLRLGNDFVAFDFAGNGFRRNPEEFWSPALKKVRIETGIDRAVLISDGSEKQIRKLFVEESPGIEIAQNRKAIQDLWILANSTAMIGVGHSSFSAWGAFLSNSVLFGSDKSRFDSFGLTCHYL